MKHRWMNPHVVILLAAAALASPSLLLPTLAAPSDTWNPTNCAFADRAFAILYPRVAPQGSLIVSIDHRANQPLDRQPFSSMLGFDSGNLTIGLGVRYSVLDSLDIGLKRYNATLTDYDVYEFGPRYQLLSEDQSFADVAAGAGATWFDAETRSDEWGGMAQLLAGKTLLRRLYVTTGAMYYSRPSALTTEPDGPDYSVAVLASANLQMLSRLALVTEWSIPVAGVWEGDPAWSVGPKYFSWGHTFSVLVSNAHSISDDRLAAGAAKRNHPIIGFTITRQF
jgi:hypothetical protein